LITRTILGEQCGSLSSSLCSFLHSPVIPSLLVPNHTHQTISIKDSVSNVIHSQKIECPGTLVRCN
jgi:hypothetical protein